MPRCAAAANYHDIFGKDNFFLEIQDQGLAMEHKIHPGLFQLEKDLGLPLVATNDSHYLCEDDAHAQDVMLCIQTGKSIHDTTRMKFDGTQFFVKNHDEMYRVFKDSPEVLTHTLDIAERCNLQLEKVTTPFPAIRCAARLHASTVILCMFRAKVLHGDWQRCGRCTSRQA